MAYAPQMKIQLWNYKPWEKNCTLKEIVLHAFRVRVINAMWNKNYRGASVLLGWIYRQRVTNCEGNCPYRRMTGVLLVAECCQPYKNILRTSSWKLTFYTFFSFPPGLFEVFCCFYLKCSPLPSNILCHIYLITFLQTINGIDMCFSEATSPLLLTAFLKGAIIESKSKIWNGIISVTWDLSGFH